MRAPAPLKELTEQELLLQLAPSAALINSVGEILYLQGATGMYLEPVEGEPGLYNILKMAKEGLRIGLTTSLLKAIKTQEIVHCPHLRVKINKHFTLINLIIRPVKTDTDTSLFLVILAEDSHQDAEKKIDSTPEMAVLEDALLIQEEQLLILHNELNTINEELKSSNEELQANIEELQSTNEELETAQEESKAINDELISTNNEQQFKAIDLSSINNDMINLIAGTGIATVFVDLNMRVIRFTPASCEVINLVESDIGRSLIDIAYHLLNYYTLIIDIQAVMDTLIPKQIDVQSLKGKWFNMRILPYRTLENIVKGAVITFIDISEIVQAREAMQKLNSNLRLAVVLRDANDAISMQDLNGQILAWNPAAKRLYGWTQEEALTMNVSHRIPVGMRQKELAALKNLGQGIILEPYRTQRLTQTGTIIEVLVPPLL
jgi:two-component system CheB/CheR fusion protein